MTDTEINIAIAQACGWTQISPGNPVIGLPPGAVLGLHTLPSYCSDLNAMATAIATLTDSEEVEFDMHLTTIMQRDEGEGWFMWQATVGQLAEAWLKTKGLWHDH